nr:phospholipase D-like domain-containing protein [Natronospira proteinivora]
MLASGHAILYKNDNRATVAWVGVIWLAPLLGSLLYLLLGINRIRRRAHALRGTLPRIQGERDLDAYLPNVLEQFVPQSLLPLSRLSNRVARQPLLGGNTLTVLHNGDQAYPAMLTAIRSARESITLSTYIFNRDRVGREFVDALSEARQRGVAIRVLVDAVGLRYSMPSIEGLLKRDSIPTAKFMPARLPWLVRFMNLRNHRKLLVVDGHKGFIGGMNIAAGNVLDETTHHPIRDIHFEVEGPVVSEMQAVFAEDWLFAVGEDLRHRAFFPIPRTPGASLARIVADGPDENYDTLRQILLGALNAAQHRIAIMTPYFLPDASLQDALGAAALRGVQVDVILPEKNNLSLVSWAIEAQLAPMMRWGVQFHFRPGPFDHSKLFTVDGQWAMIGSANWDPRSLSLNFECNLECYDEWFVQSLESHFRDCLVESQAVDSTWQKRFTLARRLRNGLARLLTPYL